MVLLEHTAGQGTALGATFEQLASIIGKTNDHRRVGVCLDTCHLLASGYDIVLAGRLRARRSSSSGGWSASIACGRFI